MTSRAFGSKTRAPLSNEKDTTPKIGWAQHHPWKTSTYPRSKTGSGEEAGREHKFAGSCRNIRLPNDRDDKPKGRPPDLPRGVAEEQRSH